MSGNAAEEAVNYKRQLEDLKKIGEKAALYEETLKTAELYKKHCADLCKKNSSFAIENAALKKENARLKQYIATAIPHSTGATPMIDYSY